MDQRYFWKVPRAEGSRSILILILVVNCLALVGSAQSFADDEDVQSWNDVQLTVPVNEKVDVFVRGTLRFGEDISRFV